jgi:hypothetical protein
MGKFTVHQSNKYITSLKLRSRGPVSGCGHSGGWWSPGLSFALPQETKNGKPCLFSMFHGHLSDARGFLSRTKTGHLPSSAG